MTTSNILGFAVCTAGVFEDVNPALLPPTAADNVQSEDTPPPVALSNSTHQYH